MLVLPACVLSYLGQGALVLADERNVSSPFFLLVPEWGRWPMVLLATAATVIASQAVITGAFSVASQAAKLGYLPRLRIRHTSSETIGQVYVPWVNWVLMISVLTLVFAFKSSAALAYAFGMAVTGTITIATLLFFYVMREQWRFPLWLVVIGATGLLLVDLLFLAANLTKLVHGAWLPLLIALVVFTIMTTWQRGRGLVTQRREEDEGSLQEFVDELHGRDPALLRVPGTAVFLNRGRRTAPLAMRANVEHNHALHEHVVIMSIETDAGAAGTGGRAARDRRPRATPTTASCHVTARFGYMETPGRAGRAAACARPAGLECPLEVDDASYFLSTIDLHAGDGADDGPLAQEAVHRHLGDHRRRGRLLPPPPRPDVDHRLDHRGVVPPRPGGPSCRSGERERRLGPPRPPGQLDLVDPLDPPEPAPPGRDQPRRVAVPRRQRASLDRGREQQVVEVGQREVAVVAGERPDADAAVLRPDAAEQPRERHPRPVGGDAPAGRAVQRRPHRRRARARPARRADSTRRPSASVTPRPPAGLVDRRHRRRRASW